MSAPSEGEKRNGNTRELRGDRSERIEVTASHLRRLAKLQCTINEAAAFFGISREHLHTRYLRVEELREAWDEGRQMGLLELRRLQWRHAQRPDASGVSMTIHLSKYWLGERTKPLENLAEALKKGLLNPDQLSDSDLAALQTLQEEALARLQGRAPRGLDTEFQGDPSATRH
jgi:hypothetical protein